MARKTIVLIFLISLAASAFGQKATICEMGEGAFHRAFGKYTINVRGSKNQFGFPECRVTLSAPRGTQVIGTDSDVELLPISGASVANNGVPSVVLHAYQPNGRANAYWIVELSDRPTVVWLFNWNTEIQFARSRDGRIEMKSCDAIFAFFQGTYTSIAESPCPNIFLQLRGSELHDASARHAAYYDKQIAELLNELAPQRIDAVRYGRKPDPSAGELYDEWRETRRIVVNAALAYLYSGREQQAWTTLQRVLPDDDFQRVKDEIVETRSRGILSKNGYEVRRLNLSSEHGRAGVVASP